MWSALFKNGVRYYAWHTMYHGLFDWPADRFFDCGCYKCSASKTFCIDAYAPVYGPWVDDLVLQ